MNLRQKAKHFKRKYEEMLATKQPVIIEHSKLRHYRGQSVFHITTWAEEEFVHEEAARSIAVDMVETIQDRIKIEFVDDRTCKATFDFWVEI